LSYRGVVAGFYCRFQRRSRVVIRDSH